MNHSIEERHLRAAMAHRGFILAENREPSTAADTCARGHECLRRIGPESLDLVPVDAGGATWWRRGRAIGSQELSTAKSSLDMVLTDTHTAAWLTLSQHVNPLAMLAVRDGGAAVAHARAGGGSNLARSTGVADHSL